jgi:hypothetical protein
MIWQPILGGVRTIAVRGWVDGRGWVDASNLASIDQQKAKAVAAAEGLARSQGSAGTAAPSAAMQASQAAALAAQNQFTIAGVEIVLERMDGQRFLRVFSVRD